MRRIRDWLPVTALGVAALVLPALAEANFVCPECSGEPVVMIGAAELVERVMSTVLQKGVGVLLLFATAVVSLPWLVAGGAVFVLTVARWVKS